MPSRTLPPRGTYLPFPPSYLLQNMQLLPVGLPFSSELPNGWGVRFSASPHLDAKKQQIEFGIDPDKKVDMSKEDENNDLDTIIEEARKMLKVTL